MGLFKDAKKAINDAQQMQADAQSMMDQANQPVDPSDPIWAPIEDITLDRYAEISAALVRQNLAGADQVTAWVETQGVKPGTWPAVQQGWTQRMGANMAVRTRYGVLYSQYQG